MGRKGKEQQGSHSGQGTGRLCRPGGSLLFAQRCVRRSSCYREAPPGVGGRGLNGVHALLFPCAPNGNTQVYFQTQVPRDTSPAFGIGLPSPTCQPLYSRGFMPFGGPGPCL